MSRCATCIYRGSRASAGSFGPGCAYLMITGKSRLGQVYKRLGVKQLNTAAREAMRPENCQEYKRGKRLEIDEKRITLTGSMPRRVPAQERKAPVQPVPKEPRPSKWDKERAAELYRAGLNDGEIGARLGVRSSTVCLWRKERKLPPNWKPPVRAEQMRSLWAEGKTDREIAEEMGIRPKTVQTWRNRQGLKRNREQMEKHQAEIMRQRQELYDKGCSDNEIAQAQGINRKTVTAWRWRMHLPEHEARDYRVIKDAEALRLWKEGFTDRMIADTLKVSIGTVRSWRRRRGIACHPDKKGHSASWEAEGRRLLAEGRTDREIAEIVGVCRSTFSQWRRRRGLPINHERSGPKEPRKKAANDL